ncbi:MCE family protein [Nocardioides sp. Leaf307]|uniref:MCE family protein n=1 Tax=Nocardioides sp. Leaf307 TaxID=1736331 RepID=UPI000702DA8B|nr:MCE family protein [Nocardioides sp. Leaf307]KQQ39710.1 virulence factor Mce [Nocardioides sp. Leaf307]
MNVLQRLIAPVILLLVVVTAVVFLTGREELKTLTAHFPRTVSIYEGSDVRVLGVPVGTVDTVTPSGTDVVVTMSYDAEVKIPADAKALIVAPAVVGDRYIQLTPTFAEGDQEIGDEEILGEDRTGVPLELDQIYSSIDELTVALGPNGANAEGALTDLLQVTARNFGGEGEQLNQTISDFGKLSTTLDDNKEELFASVNELESFIGTLARNDQTVRDFNQSLAGVSEVLAGERQELASSLANLSTALGEVSTFVETNREVLGRDIEGLNRVAKVLVRQRAALEETLEVAPLALNNLALTYNPQAGTLDVSANIQNALGQIQNDPALLLCTIVDQADSTGNLCDLLDGVLPRPGALKALRGGGDGAARSGPLFDSSLGGLVEVP